MRIKLMLLLAIIAAFCAAIFCLSACGGNEATYGELDNDIVRPGTDDPEDGNGDEQQGGEPSGGQGDGETPPESGVEEPHSHSLTYIAASPASCTQNGNVAYWLCDGCGLYFSDGEASAEISAEDIVIPSAHDYEERAVPPTCTERGYTELICAACGDCVVDESSYTPAVGHSFGGWEIVEEPSCEEYGERVRRCAECGEPQSQIVQPLGHRYSAEVKEATCTEDGYTDYRCTACGDGYRGDYVSAIGHNYVEYTVAATCQSAGYTLVTCLRCGDEYIEEGSYTPSGDHSFGEWYALSPELCLVGGTQERRCIYCGETERRTVPAQGHSYEASYEEEPSCTEGGYTRYVCSVCGDEKYEFSAMLGHNFGEWRETQAGTCVSVGEEERVCLRCGETERRTTAAGPHDYEKTIVAPTCEEGGFTLYRCRYCGDLAEGDFTQSLGHDYGQWQTVKTPSCTSEGKEISYCSRCGRHITRVTAKAEHDYVLASISEPTCSQDGSERYECAVCGGEYVRTTEEKLGHDYTEVAVGGVLQYLCSRCGDSYTLPAEPQPPTEGSDADTPDSPPEPEEPGPEPEEPDDGTDEPDVEPEEPAATEGLIYVASADGLSYTVAGMEDGAVAGALVIPSEYLGLPVTAVSAGAFENNAALTSVCLGKNILTIGARAFAGCSSLGSVNIPQSVTYIGEGAFRHCTALSAIDYGAVSAECALDVFFNAGTAGEGIVLSVADCVVSIPANLFASFNERTAPKLTEIEFCVDSALRSIGDQAFYGCVYLVSVSLPATVEHIGLDAFGGCTSLTYVGLPSSAELQSGVFGGANSSFELFVY